tara:strand:+ start:35 stop:772 length:738 start_codon:yes stop_codon:yes gene_type:complete
MISIKEKLKQGRVSLGSWMQLGSSEVAEMMGDAGFDWVAVDMEHGSIAHHQLPDIFRALQLNNTAPFVRIAKPDSHLAIQALESGAKGIIVPNVNDAWQIEAIKNHINYPPIGSRGVGFNRGNGYGKYFEDYLKFEPFLVAMIEDHKSIGEVKAICQHVDAILVGPYDLSASLGCPGDFEGKQFKQALAMIHGACKHEDTPMGIHVVHPDLERVQQKMEEGYKFISYSADTVILEHALRKVNKII